MSETLAYLSYVLMAWLFGTISLAYFRKRSWAAFTTTSLFAITVLVRPPLLLSGLDDPLVYFNRGQLYEGIAVANLAVAAWLAVFAASNRLSQRGLADSVGFVLPSLASPPPERIAFILALLITALAAMTTAALVASQGGIAHFMYAVKIEKALAGAYVFRQIAMIGAICSLLGLMCSARPAPERMRARRLLRASSLFWFGGLIAVNLALNYLWGNRANIGYFLIAAGITYHIYIRPFRLSEILFLGLILGGSLQALRMLRETFIEDVIYRDIDTLEQQGWVRNLSLSLHFVEYDGLMMALRDAGNLFSFRWGEDFLNGLFAFVPRFMWPDKPFTFTVGSWFRQVYQPGVINGWPVTVVGDWYVNFSWPGIGAGAFLSGVVTAGIDSAYRDASRNAWSACMVTMLASFVVSNGGLGTGAVQSVVLYLVPLALIAFFLRERRPRLAVRRASPTGR